MIDYDTVLGHFITAAQDAVGASLSISGTEPSVIKARKGKTKPAYPYVVLDVISEQAESGWLLRQGLTVDEKPWYETTKSLLLSYVVYGGNAVSIANQLQDYFMMSSVLVETNKVTGGNIVDTLAIRSVPQVLATKYIEAAQFNIIFNIIDRRTETDAAAFDTVETEGTITP